MLKLEAWETRMPAQVALCAPVSASLCTVCEARPRYLYLFLLQTISLLVPKRMKKKIHPTWCNALSRCTFLEDIFLEEKVKVEKEK